VPTPPRTASGPAGIRPQAFLSVLAGVVLLSTIGAGADGTDDSADFEYALGSAASGTILSHCDASAILFPAASTHALRFSSREAVLERYTTEWNTTTLLPASGQPLVVPSAARQWHDEPVTLHAGEGELSWDEAGRAQIFGPSWPDSAVNNTEEHFAVELRTDALRTGPPGVVGDAGKFYVEQGREAALLQAAVPGWNRLVQTGSGTARVSGSLAVYLEEAKILDAAAVAYDLPPAHERRTIAETAVAASYQNLHRHAILRLTDAILDVDAPQVSFACKGMQSSINGTLLAHEASGRLHAGGEETSFGPIDLSIGGRYTLSEDVTSSPQGAPTVRGQASGAFTIVGFDFKDSGLGVPFSPLAAATAGAFLVGVLLTVLGWRLYTRLEKPVLLELETRTAIYEAIRANPWSTATHLSRATGFSRSTVRYQLGVLHRHGLIRSQSIGERPRYALLGTDVPPRPEDPVRDALELALRDGPQRLSHVMRVLIEGHEYSRFGAWKAIRRAAGDGAIQVQRNGAEVWVECTA